MPPCASIAAPAAAASGCEAATIPFGPSTRFPDIGATGVDVDPLRQDARPIAATATSARVVFSPEITGNPLRR
jgi:hypothetical protein